MSQHVSPLWNIHIALVVLTAVVALVIVWKAARAYQQNSDRGMALLAGGMFFLVVAPIIIDLLLMSAIEPTSASEIVGWRLAEQLFRFTGIVTILASIYVRP